MTEQSVKRQTLYTQLTELRETRNRELDEFSQLLIERSRYSSYHRIRGIAEKDLSMEFPDTVTTLKYEAPHE